MTSLKSVAQGKLVSNNQELGIKEWNMVMKFNQVGIYIMLSPSPTKIHEDELNIPKIITIFVEHDLI